MNSGSSHVVAPDPRPLHEIEEGIGHESTPQRKMVQHDTHSYAMAMSELGPSHT